MLRLRFKLRQAWARLVIWGIDEDLNDMAGDLHLLHKRKMEKDDHYVDEKGYVRVKR